MSLIFFTKRVYEPDEPIGFCGVDLDQVAISIGIRSAHDLLADSDLRFFVWRFYLLPALKDTILWRELHWLRFIVDRTDRHATRIWVYGRTTIVPNVQSLVFQLLQTRFISFSAPMHLNSFNRAWSLASFSAPRSGDAFKIETVRDLESLYQDNFNLNITDDYDVVFDFQ